MSQSLDHGPVTDLSEIGGHWDTREPLHHQGQTLPPWRRVAILPGRSWPNTPEKCTAFDEPGEWICDGQVLVCTGCGLDAT